MHDEIFKMNQKLEDFSDNVREICRECIELLSNGECKNFNCFEHILLVNEKIYYKNLKLFDKIPDTISIRIVERYLVYDMMVVDKKVFLKPYE